MIFPRKFNFEKSEFLRLSAKKSAVIISLVLVFSGIYLWRNYDQKVQLKNINQTSCFKIEEHKITGHSLEPLIKDGTEVKGLIDYYDCNPIRRGEMAIIKFKTSEKTFVKRIMGLPGDKLEFVENNLKLNEQILKNSTGETYLFDERAKKIITIPLKAGFIPEERYFVLSNERGPSAFDSRYFGLIEKEHLKGKVELAK